MGKYVGIQAQQRRNNIKSLILLFLFPCLIIALPGIALIFVVSVGQLIFYLQGKFFGEDEITGWLSILELIEQGYFISLKAAPYVAGFCLVWFVIAYFFNVRLIQVATGAKILERKENKRVYNLVENLCIAVNMDMPKINLIEDDSINAFASGINKKSYTVTLSRGAINKLKDDELEGVIAHELTHIRNNDVKLLIVSILFVGILSFLVLALTSVVLKSRSLAKKIDDGGIGFIAFLLLIVATVAYGIGLLMRFAISRQREFMADAGAAEMTHKPWALASALRKIAEDPLIECIKHDDVAQLFIEHPSTKKSIGLFATHPPIEKRIEILEQF